MLHSIGRTQRAERDLVDLLVDCHGRIRTFSGLALEVGTRTTAAHREVVEVCSRVERYFTDALPLHVRDEEDSLLPRLRGRLPEVDETLERMAGEHHEHEALLQRLLAASAKVRAEPGDPRFRADLLDSARALVAAFEPHLRAEEEIVLPAVRALVSGEEQAAITAELTARRRLRPLAGA